MSPMFIEPEDEQSELEREVQSDPRVRTATEEQFSMYTQIAKQWGHEGLQHLLHAVYTHPENPDIIHYFADISSQQQQEVQQASAKGTERLKKKLSEISSAKIMREMMTFFRSHHRTSVIDEPSFYAWLDMHAELLEPTCSELAPPRAWLGSDHTTSDYARTDTLLKKIAEDIQMRANRYAPHSGGAPIPPTLSPPTYRPAK